jgi:hypothetical protein
MLMVFTFASVAVAIGLAFYAWQLARRERLRSNARVAALAAAIEGTSTGDAAAAMFTRDPAAGVQGRPLLKVAIGFAMAVFVIVLIAMTGDRPGAPAAGEIEGTVGQQQSLELLSMRHERAGEDLTVTGLVRNPGAPTTGDIIAVVLAFDREGGFMASGRAPLEFGRIAAGDESPFRVTVPGVKDVGRYRVSFRTDSGVVRHVDRRPTGSGLVSGRPAPGGSHRLLAAN